MQNNPYSNERAKERRRAREAGEQTTQRNWDNFSLGKEQQNQTRQQPTINYGEINKIVNDAISSIKQSIINEAVQVALSTLKNNQEQKKQSGFDQKEVTKQQFEPVKAPLFNYKILAPNGGPPSGITAEIPFKPSKLHVLGLQGDDLKWIETEDC